MRSFYLPVHGAYLRYIDTPGESPAILFLAGMGLPSTATYPRIAAEPEIRERRCIMPDLLGTGYSDAPASFSYTLEQHAAAMAGLLDRLQIRGAVVVGHSMGGSVAIALAHDRPDLVSRLVLAEANLDPGGGMASAWIAAQTEEAFVEEGFVAFQKMFWDRFEPGDEVESVPLGMVQVADARALHRSATGLVAGTQPTMREMLVQMTIPRLYVFGDQSLPDPDFNALPGMGVDVAVIAEAGHGLVWDNPTDFAAVLRGFLR